MRNLIWIVVALLIAAGGYMLFSGKTPDEVVNEAAGAVGVSLETETGSETASD